MLTPEIEAALNKQLNHEQNAAQEYLAMAAFFEHCNLAGFARYMRRQSEEEREHALRIFDHISGRGGRVMLGSVAAPRGDFASVKAVFEAALARERANTASINEVYKLAVDTDDYATQTMLHWFISEQVEEEEWGEEALALLEMVGDNKSAMLMLDKRYGERADASD